MLKQTQKPWTEELVASILAKRFPPPAWAFLTQVRRGTGFAHSNTADAIAVHTWPSRGLFIVGAEIKVVRGDWMRELKKVGKSDEIQKFCKHWYIVTPSRSDVIREDEIPTTWGHIEVTRRGTKIIKSAPDLKPAKPDMFLLASIMRNAARSMVPRDEVDDQIHDGIEAALERRSQDIGYQLNALRAAVKKFEDASGVSIGDEWEAGRVGEAVKLIVGTGYDGIVQLIQKLQVQHADAAAAMDSALTQLREVTHEPSE